MMHTCTKFDVPVLFCTGTLTPLGGRRDRRCFDSALNFFSDYGGASRHPPPGVQRREAVRRRPSSGRAAAAAKSMTKTVAPGAGALERAIALVRLTQGRVDEDHLSSARQRHAAASLHARADSSSNTPTTVGSLATGVRACRCGCVASRRVCDAGALRCARLNRSGSCLKKTRKHGPLSSTTSCLAGIVPGLSVPSRGCPLRAHATCAVL